MDPPGPRGDSGSNAGMSDALTPMMVQYRKLRAELPAGTLLFFRLGDFYEMFFEDAQEASRILDITLTRRNGIPMCGVPYHAADGYLAMLIRAGKKVAICDQMEDPARAKGIVRREVTGVVTPGTALQDTMLSPGRNNYLAGVCRSGRALGLAMLDLSTGAFWVEEVADAEALSDHLRRHAPRECVLSADPDCPGGDELAAAGRAAGVGVLTPCAGWVFQPDVARDRLLRQFGVHSLDSYGIEGRPAMIGAAGALLHYVQEELHRDTRHVRVLRLSQADGFMTLDPGTVENLGLIATRAEARSSAEPTTLLEVLDVTRTAMGARLLRDWVLRPLSQLDGIVLRQEAVAACVSDRARLDALREALGEVRDMERLIARLSSGSGAARDVMAVRQSLAVVPAVRPLVDQHPAALLAKLGANLDALPELGALIDRAISDTPPLTLKEGGVIRAGYNAELDALRAAGTQGRQWLAEYQTREQARTGIKTLKVRHNNVFGYYLEVSKGQLANVPADYIRKQTVTSGERYVTPELKDYENRIVGAWEKSLALETELFQEVRTAVVRETASLQATAAALAQLDVLTALADRALSNRYVRPRMTVGGTLTICEGRHPVVELRSDAERFVPNDTLLNVTDHQVVILTGPNMAGKSTYIRQVGVIAVMAHIGSFVPASAAEIGLLDRVFTRVGASDDLARGRSTFLVEMQETANILHHATPRSLIILDEIGRGTSTFDGISIAWAVAEHLHNTAAVKAKTLFATHYHELTDLALTLSGVKNYSVLVHESGDGIVFLRRIVPGGADKSYGIHVARLAGMPEEVVERAREILANLEEGELAETGQPKLARRTRRGRVAEMAELPLFAQQAKK